MSQRIAYQYKQNGSIVLYVNGMITVGKDDVNYTTITEALKAGDDDAVRRSLTVKTLIADHTDGRVQIFGSEVHVDKKPLPRAVADRILTLFKNKMFNLTPMFRLLENIESNPEEFSRKELYLFLEQNSLPFTPDGHFLAYKMVRSDYFDIYSGKIANRVGDIAQMPREDVDTNRHNTCSVGLHFCSFNYLGQAYSLGKEYRLMVVKINPADVVSIPSDYNNSKGRTWRYEVVDELEHFEDSIPENYTDKYSTEVPATKAAVKKVPAKKEKVAEKTTADYSAKLVAADVRKIRKMLKEDWTIAGIANTFHVSARQIARIRDGQAWADLK